MKLACKFTFANRVHPPLCEFHKITEVRMRTIKREWRRVSTNHNGKVIYTEPRTAEFGEHKIEVINWTELLQQVCDIIAQENLNEFLTIISAGYICARSTPYFRRCGEFETETRPYTIGGTGLDVRCNLAANNVHELCNALTELFGYGPIKVELR